MGGVTRTLSHVYDRNRARTRITHPDSNQFDTIHDGLGRPTNFNANGATLGYQGFYPHGGVGDRVLANGASLHLGRFLQTDPIGYQDQFNLYAYVGNDPVNRTDPSGLCQRDTDTGEILGVCAFSAAEGDFVTDLLADEGIKAFDLEAAQAGRLVYVRFGDTTLGSRRPDGSVETPAVSFDGEKLEEETGGERRMIVNVDRRDRMTVFGIDRRTGRPRDHVNSSQENAAHGLGHAQDKVRGTNSGEVNANEMENGWRQRHRIDVNFVREGHGGRRDECPTASHIC